MNGYKGMNKYMICKGFAYELGETYTFDGNIALCSQGFHFCKNLHDVFDYCSPNDSGNRFFEVEALGNIIEGTNKCVTSRIKIIRELSKVEVNRTLYGNGNDWGLEYEYKHELDNGYGCGYEYAFLGGYSGRGDGGIEYGCVNGNGHSYGDRFICRDGRESGWGCKGYNIQQVLKLK